MEFDSKEIFHHRTWTRSCDRISTGSKASQNNENKLSVNKQVNDFKRFPYQSPLLSNRSNSISIPVSKQLNISDESVYSQSYTCGYLQNKNYGTINDGLANEHRASENFEKRKLLSTSESSNSSQVSLFKLVPYHNQYHLEVLTAAKFPFG